jgi:hypothetical protein
VSRFLYASNTLKGRITSQGDDSQFGPAYTGISIIDSARATLGLCYKSKGSNCDVFISTKVLAGSKQWGARAMHRLLALSCLGSCDYVTREPVAWVLVACPFFPSFQYHEIAICMHTGRNGPCSLFSAHAYNGNFKSGQRETD